METGSVNGRLCSTFVRRFDGGERIEGKEVFIEFPQKKTDVWYREELLSKINKAFSDTKVENGNYYLELYYPDTRGNIVDAVKKFQLNSTLHWDGYTFSTL